MRVRISAHPKWSPERILFLKRHILGIHSGKNQKCMFYEFQFIWTLSFCFGIGFICNFFCIYIIAGIETNCSCICFWIRMFFDPYVLLKFNFHSKILTFYPLLWAILIAFLRIRRFINPNWLFCKFIFKSKRYVVTARIENLYHLNFQRSRFFINSTASFDNPHWNQI